MVFDEDIFVKSVADYIKTNDEVAKKYLEEFAYGYYKKVRPIKLGYRLWAFKPSYILNLVVKNIPIIIRKSEFLSFFKSVNNVKTLSKALLDDSKYFMGIVEEDSTSDLYDIYSPFYNYNGSNKEHVDKIYDEFYKEGELLRFNNSQYNLTYDNIAVLVIHNDFIDFFNLSGTDILNDKYSLITLKKFKNQNTEKLERIFKYERILDQKGMDFIYELKEGQKIKTPKKIEYLEDIGKRKLYL